VDEEEYSCDEICKSDTEKAGSGVFFSFFAVPRFAARAGLQGRRGDRERAPLLGGLCAAGVRSSSPLARSCHSGRTGTWDCKDFTHGVKCFTANAAMSDYGHSCFSGKKICCCEE